VLACVDFEALSYREAAKFNLADYDTAKRHAVMVDIAGGKRFDVGTTPLVTETIAEDRLDRPALIRRMLDVVPNPWQAARILDEALARSIHQDS
jgi:type III restriction enzyme